MPDEIKVGNVTMWMMIIHMPDEIKSPNVTMRMVIIPMPIEIKSAMSQCLVWMIVSTIARWDGIPRDTSRLTLGRRLGLGGKGLGFRVGVGVGSWMDGAKMDRRGCFNERGEKEKEKERGNTSGKVWTVSVFLTSGTIP
ncbi:hypothetical protein TREMEDRAFT_66312 [Tremella mesenterica DSM 1558]|uniref:uncharacterized protein n=1 Tax=Tremella mesenterica (strain ATCC 24925 / CBS 8224 / DSM 1558 / NBRC 9311 / NRRL Y-6157 / RJB 2259-6 / UBC 559-6) TaxID=578456 RepID=UPI00032B97AE|nr:uncharacterized protein TREMEDRAFT_66312 [Tremella mesenterica DSM 1558]EIW65715.1 hypothetical protein TREMEDRAFT_66312 [Tremella mesenterica DSM 1558]